MSGINEHNEARRKEGRKQMLAYHKRRSSTVLERLPYSTLMMMMKNMDQDPSLMQPGQNSYETEVQLRKMGSPPLDTSGVGHDSLSTDRQRRECVRQQQIIDYSAKLPNRLNSIDYKKQW
ncbi:uncharacterized protein [Argopecten irradians]|uniref:uncharacterized protein isoform X1 n=1 Tax=Argopecten irradians TaxID=31199 RepID=UPI00371BC220